MRAVFVTGGSGFVGRNLIAALRARGDEVRALVRSDAAAATVTNAGAVPVRAELTDTGAMTAAMRGCAVVFHAAAKVEEWGTAADFHAINVAGTEAVLAAARAAEVPALVHVSTEAVLVGGPPIVNADESRPLPPRPIGLYAQTKGLAETRVREASSETLRTVVVRPRLIWGEGDTAVLPKLVEAVRTGRFMWIGGGRHLTSTCHVKNVVEGMLLAAERGRGGEVYFLTDGPPTEMRAFMTAMLQSRGVTPGDRSVPRSVAHALAIAGDALWRAVGAASPPPLVHGTFHLIGEEVTVVDAKARRELGYVGHVTREAGLAGMRYVPGSPRGASEA